MSSIANHIAQREPLEFADWAPHVSGGLQIRFTAGYRADYQHEAAALS